MHCLRLPLLALAFFASGLPAQAAEPFLKIVGLEKTVTFTAAEFAALPRTEVKLAEQMGKQERTYAGVTLRELLVRAGAPLGDGMRGDALMQAVIVRCKDGYAVLYALAEFDESFSNRTILLADKEDGQILPPSAAPLRVVAPGDKRGARSARQVVALEIVSLAKP
jgi:DMSO/TMAO reductase YedYZ molybdopterin-dependent catalytic subunit